MENKGHKMTSGRFKPKQRANIENKGKRCKEPDCMRNARCKGFCIRHYQKSRGWK